MMNPCLELVTAMVQAKKDGHLGVFSVNELAFLLRRPVDQAFRQLLSRCLNSTPIERVTRGFYACSLARPDHAYRLERLAMRLRANAFNYVSLETELSRLGLISQATIDYLTVMTTGRSGIHKTTLGTIEFTHTSKDIQQIREQLYYDTDAGIFRATPELALRDLRRVGRNLDMVDQEFQDAC